MYGHSRRSLIVCITLGALLLVAGGLVFLAHDPGSPSPDISPRSLVFHGQGYGLYTPAEGERANLRHDTEIGQLTFRWQSAGALPPQTPIYRVSADPTPEITFVPTDELIAIEINQRVVFYHPQPYGDPNIGAVDVLLGTVERVERAPCPENPCFGQQEVTRITLVIAQVWQSVQGIEGTTLTILIGDSSAMPTVGSTIVTLVRRSAAILEQDIPQFFWAEPQFLYTVMDEHLVPMGNIPADEPLLMVNQARAAVTEIFAGACVTTPPRVPSPTVRLPETPFPTAVPPRRQC